MFQIVGYYTTPCVPDRTEMSVEEFFEIALPSRNISNTDKLLGYALIISLGGLAELSDAGLFLLTSFVG